MILNPCGFVKCPFLCDAFHALCSLVLYFILGFLGLKHQAHDLAAH